MKLGPMLRPGATDHVQMEIVDVFAQLWETTDKSAGAAGTYEFFVNIEKLLGKLEIEAAKVLGQTVLDLTTVIGHRQRIGQMNRVIELSLESLTEVNEYYEVLKTPNGRSNK